MTWEREKILELQAEIKRLMMKIKRLEAEVERLKAIGSDKIEAACREEVQRLMKKITTDSIEAYKEGVEDAVKIAQNDALGLGIAIAIQKLL